VMMPFLVLAVVAGIVFVQEGQRRIPVQYAKRVIGRRMSEGGQTYLPLRVNMAGVIPVIFAASLMAFPPTVGQLVKTHWGQSLSDFFTPNGWHYVLGESILIIIFTYFYTAVTFNPVDQAENLKKYGGFIPGVRPGRPTAEFLDRILARLTFPGALFLAAVAALVLDRRADRDRGHQHLVADHGGLDVDTGGRAVGQLSGPDRLTRPLVECLHAVGRGGVHPSRGNGYALGADGESCRRGLPDRPARASIDSDDDASIVLGIDRVSNDERGGGECARRGDVPNRCQAVDVRRDDRRSHRRPHSLVGRR